MTKLTETISVKHEVTDERRDLVLFVKRLAEQGLVALAPHASDERLLQCASDFCETQHGDD